MLKKPLVFVRTALKMFYGWGFDRIQGQIDINRSTFAIGTPARVPGQIAQKGPPRVFGAYYSRVPFTDGAPLIVPWPFVPNPSALTRQSIYVHKARFTPRRQLHVEQCCLRLYSQESTRIVPLKIACRHFGDIVLNRMTSWRHDCPIIVFERESDINHLKKKNYPESNSMRA